MIIQTLNYPNVLAWSQLVRTIEVALNFVDLSNSGHVDLRYSRVILHMLVPPQQQGEFTIRDQKQPAKKQRIVHDDPSQSHSVGQN